MTKITPKQQAVLNAIKQLGKGSVVEVSKVMNTDIKSTYAHLLRLHKIELIHIAEWGKSKSGQPLKIYALGKGVDAVVDKKKHYANVKQDAERKALTKRKAYDPNAPLAPNNGWLSTIYSWDRAVSQHDHIEFMARFHPHPDYAAAWLFHQPNKDKRI
jgi:hypothetical protein